MLQTIRQLADLVRPIKKAFYWYLLMIFFYEGAQVANSYILTAALRIYERQKNLDHWMVAVLGVILFDQTFRLLDHNLDFWIIKRILYPIQTHVKNMIIKIFLTQDSSWHQKNNSGVLIGKAQSGYGKLEEMTNMLCWEFMPTAMQAILTFPPLLYFSPLIASLIVISLGVFIFITYHAEKFRLPHRKIRHDLYEKQWQDTEEAVKAHETLAIYNQTDRVLDEYKKTNQDIVDMGNIEAKKTIHWYHGWRITANQFTDRAILALLIFQLHRGQIIVPEVFFVATLSARLLTAFWRFARMMQNVGECGEGIARLHDISRQKPTIFDSEDVDPNFVIPKNLTIEFKNVSFRYPGSNIDTISNFNLVIFQGQEIGVVGPSGSGKTTLRRLLFRLYDVTEGEILIGGIPIKKWPLKKLRSLFAFVPQGDEVFIFDSDIAYNISFSNPSATKEQIRLAAKQAGLINFIDSLPEGLATKVGEKGLKLSGGQKQRVALARAIISKRLFLILDEATSSVDALTEQEIQKELKEVFGNVTAIVIAHRMPTIWGADKIVVINKGQLENEGSHEILMKETGGTYFKMIQLQTQYKIIAV